MAGLGRSPQDVWSGASVVLMIFAFFSMMLVSPVTGFRYAAAEEQQLQLQRQCLGQRQAGSSMGGFGIGLVEDNMNNRIKMTTR
jgi:hypothetical protein